MKLNNPYLIAALVGAVAVAASTICHLGKDNVVEQVAEDIIKSQTGIMVDLSPEPSALEKVD